MWRGKELDERGLRGIKQYLRRWEQCRGKWQIKRSLKVEKKGEGDIEADEYLTK